MDWKLFVQNTIELMGFQEWNVELDEENRHGAVFIHDHAPLVHENLPSLVKHVNHLLQLVAKKHGEAPVYFDINNYRREREELIVELARAAARKVLAKEEEIALPAMNAYERRLVHVELAMHPEIATESMGEGRGRYVVVKLLSKTKPGAEQFEREGAHEKREEEGLPVGAKA